MSTAWYKPGVAAKLLATFSTSQRGAASSSSSSSRNVKPTTNGNHKATKISTNSGGRRHRQVQVWNTTCAVTNAGKSSAMACTVLLNPANPQLSGVSRFPYFPKGGPAPKAYPQKDSHHIMGYVTQWGGMEVGTGMLFASNTVDGLVHQLGGWRLALQCRLLPVVAPEDNEKCPVGQAVVTGPGGSDLQHHFDWIVHTAPPFYHHHHHPNPEQFLLDCYQNALAVSFEKGSRVCSPLLGAGCRGFSVEIATNLAAKASVRWYRQQSNSTTNQHQQQHEETLAFAIPDIAIAQQLIEAMENNADKQSDI